MTRTLLQSQTTEPLLFFMVLASDHHTPATGLVPVVTLSKNGAAFGAASGAVAEISSGWYKVAGNATDTATLGPLLLHAAVATADNVDMDYQIVKYNPQDGVRLGLTSLPNVIVNTSGGLPTVDANIEVKVNTVRTVSDKVSYGLSTLESRNLQNGTAQAGAASSITLAAAASATDNLYVGMAIKLYSGTGGGQARVITGYVGSTKVATVDRAWIVNPDSSSVYSVLAESLNKLDSSLQVTAASVQGNVTGSVASVTGAVASVTGGVTVTTNNDKTGYTASTVSDKAGYSLSVTPPTAAQVAAVVLATPANLLATDATGRVTVGTNADKTGYTASTVSDKTGYALTAGEHTSIATDAQTGMTAQGYTSTRGPKLDNLDAAVSSRNATTPPTVAAIRAEMDANSTRLDTNVGSRMATFTYSAPPTVAAIDTQLTGTHGSGSWLSGSGGSSSDPLTNAVGSYAAGTIGYAISQIGAGRITVSSLQSGTQVRLATGYDQTLVFTDASNSWPDLTGASILMLTNVIYLGSAFSHAGTVVQATGTNKSVSVALLHTETVGMPVATNYKYDIQATLADGVTQLSLVKGGQLVTLAKPG